MDLSLSDKNKILQVFCLSVFVSVSVSWLYLCPFSLSLSVFVCLSLFVSQLSYCSSSVLKNSDVGMVVMWYQCDIPLHFKATVCIFPLDTQNVWTLRPTFLVFKLKGRLITNGRMSPQREKWWRTSTGHGRLWRVLNMTGRWHWDRNWSGGVRWGRGV